MVPARSRAPARPRRASGAPLVPAAGLRKMPPDLLADQVMACAKASEYLRGDAPALADEAEQDVLGADVVVAEAGCLPPGELKDLLGARGERDVPGRGLLALPDDLLHLLAHGLKADPERLKRLGGHALALMDEAEQDVLRADVVVVEHPGLFLSQDHNPPRQVGKPLKHFRHAPLPSRASRHRASRPGALGPKQHSSRRLPECRTSREGWPFPDWSQCVAPSHGAQGHTRQ